mgnify:CR=1 FL=1
MDYRMIIGLGIIFAVFVSDHVPSVKNVLSSFTQKSINLVDEKPSDDIIEKSSKISELITEKPDRINFAIFNLQFAGRLDGYYQQNISAQQLASLYGASLSEYFKDSIDGKYIGLDTQVKQIFVDSFGTLDHILSEQEISSFREVIIGLAWKLSN